MNADAIANVIAGMSALFAALVWWWGVYTWKREHLGRRKIQLGELTLALFYEAKEAVHDIRNPIVFIAELQGRPRATGEDPTTTSALDRAHVVFKRFERHKKVFTKLHALKFRFRAHFNTMGVCPFEGIERIMHGILVDAQMLGENFWRPEWVPEDESKRTEFLKQRHDLERTIWRRPINKDDSLSNEVNALIVRVEGIVAPHVGRSSSAHS